MRRTKHSRTQLHSRNIKLLMLFWTLAIMASLYGNLHSQQQSRDTSLRMQAVAVHGLEMEYRNWVIRNGGVYAQVSDQVQPSQWLSHVPERDVRTPSGKQLTLLNSSYVVRLVHEAMRTSGNTLRDHIASLRPINPANTADAWERKALEAFSRGESEAASLDVLGDGKTYYRYMKPMVTEESCLKCHARFGDKLGDIRGGVSVAIPVDTVMLAGRNERNAIIAGHGVVWGLGMLGLFVGGRKQQQAMRAVELGEEILRVNEERLHFATIAGNIGIWDWDIVNNELVWDESMYALYGIRQEDFGGAYDAWISTLHPGDREATDAEIQAALRGEREYAPEFRIVRPDGTIRKIKAASKTYYDDKGKPLRMVGTNIDITERKESERRLLESENRLRLTLEFGRIGIWDWDVKSGFWYVSATCYTMLGYEPREGLAERDEWMERVHPDDRALVDDKVQDVLSGRSNEYRYEARMRHADGSYRWQQVMGFGIGCGPDGMVARMLGIGMDIHERKRAESALAMLNRSLRMLSDTSWALVHITDETALLNEVCRIAVDVGGYRLAWIGFAEHDEGKTLRPVAHAGSDSGYIRSARVSWGDNERGKGPGGEAIRSGHPCTVRHIMTDPAFIPWREAAMQRGYQSLIALPLANDGQIYGALGIYSREEDAFDTDEVEILKELASNLAFGITALRGREHRARVEAALKQSDEKYRELIQKIQVAVVVHAADTRILISNSKAQELLGLSGEQLQGKAALDPAWHFFREDGSVAPVEEYPVNRVLASGAALRNLIFGVSRPGGNGWVLVNAEPVFGEEGKIAQVIVTFSDMTERKLAEEEIKALNRELELRVNARTAELEAANKELEAFSFSVSHDLRTPLRAIDGFSQILLEDYERRLDAEGCRLLHVVRDNTRKMGALIDDILKFSRAGRAELSRAEIDMAALAREVYAELQSPVAAKNLRLEIEAIPTAQCDRAMMRQVFANLLSNALKFSHTREKPEIRVGSFIDGGETVYFVRDNGVGFDMQYADKLFGVFQRLHSVEEFEGTGIGLAIVKRIVARHGGRVWAEGKVNEGATVYFSMPPAASPQ